MTTGTGTHYDAEVLAEGEDAVIAFLESAGIADFAVDGYLDLGGGVGRWPGGTMLPEYQGSTETLMATVTLDRFGVYRVERGPAELFWELLDPYEDEDDGDEVE